jgi:PST family polysaccharide transporter
MMQRNLDFKNYSIILMYEKIFTTIFQIIMAFVGFGFWSLIYGKLVGVSLIAFMAARKMSWWPKLHYDHEAAKELFSFGFMVFLRNLFRYGVDNVDYFWVTKFLGVGALGFYERAFTLMKLPQKRITKGIKSVAFSAFSRIQDQPEKIRLAFRKLVLGTSLLSFPILTGLAFIAPLLIPIALGGGDKWLPTVIPLQIMCAAGIIYSIDSYLNTVLTAIGLVKYIVVRRVLEFILVAITTFYGVQYGINGVALAILITSVIVMLIMMVIITRKTIISWADYFAPQFPSIITSVGMLGVMYGITILLTTYLQLPDFVMLCVQICIGFVSYIGLHLIFRFKLVIALLDELSKDAKGFGGKMIKKVKKMKSKIYEYSDVKSTA